MAEETDTAPGEKYQPNFNLFFFRDPVSETMQIPNGFSKHLTEPLPKKIVLRNNSGNLWTMMLERTDDSLFLGEGWKKFTADNELKAGESLLLEYDGIRVFNVRIFNRTGREVIRREVEIQEIGNDEEHDEKHTDLSYSSEEGDNTDSGEECVSSREKQIQRLKTRQKEVEVGGLTRGRYSPVNDENVKKYLSNPSNPFMVTRLAKRFNELHIKSKIIKYFSLKFPKVIYFIDSFGNLEGRTAIRGDGRLCINGWISICKRNNFAPKDEIICEFQHEGGWVHSIKIHASHESNKVT